MHKIGIIEKIMFDILKNHPGLLAQISQKGDGNMKVWLEPAKMGDKILRNRKKYFSGLEIENEKVVSAELMHSDAVYKVTKIDGGKIILKVDALITNAKNIFLSVTVADCLPLFLFDPKREAIGLIHAGWRGLAKNIIAKTVAKMQTEFGSVPVDVLVVVGPGISAEYYEVAEEVARLFEKYADALRRSSGKTFLDLKKVASNQLLSAGVLLENIEISPECTFSETEKYFSYRRDRPDNVQAMVAVIGIKE